MISSNEFTRKMIEARKKDKNYGEIITDFLQELLIDMDNRYDVTGISHPVVAAAFKLHSEILYSKLCESGKKICDLTVEGINKGDKQGDTAGGTE